MRQLVAGGVKAFTAMRTAGREEGRGGAKKMKKKRFFTKWRDHPVPLIEEAEKFTDETNFMPDIPNAVDVRFRQELMRIMGTEVIRLNDPEWNKKYHASIRQDYKKQLEEKEKRLIHLEKVRLRRLKLEGLIEEEEEVCQVRSEKPKKKKSKKIKMTFSAPPKILLVPMECTDDELQRRRKAIDNRRKLLTYRPLVDLLTEIRKISEEMASEKPQHVRFIKEKQQEEELIRQGKQRPSSAFIQEGETEPVGYIFDNKHHRESDVTPDGALKRLSLHLPVDALVASIEQPQKTQESKLLSKEERKLQTNLLLSKKTAKKRLGKVLPPELEEMYQEESLSGLYALAKRLLCTT